MDIRQGVLVPCLDQRGAIPLNVEAPTPETKEIIRTMNNFERNVVWEITTNKLRTYQVVLIGNKVDIVLRVVPQLKQRVLWVRHHKKQITKQVSNKVL